MGILRKAQQEVVQLYLDDEKTDFISVLSDISKRQFNAIVGSMPGKVGDEMEMSIAQATDFQKTLFATFVVGWSLEGVEPTVEAYEELDMDSANAIDSVLAQHFANLNPGNAESKSPTTSRGKAAKASA